MIQRSMKAFMRKMDIPAAIVYALAGLAGYGLFTLISAVTDRAAPVDYIEARAVQISAPAGGTIDIRFDVYRYRICPVIKINRYLVDSTGTEHAVNNYTMSQATRPGRETYDRNITIPENVAPGRAYYFIRLTYACNFIHNLGWPIMVQSPPVYFAVTLSETKGLNLPMLVYPPQFVD
jgi:hypothetical protein